MFTIEKHSPHLLHAARQTQVPPRSEVTALVATDAETLLEIGPLLRWDCTESLTIAKIKH